MNSLEELLLRWQDGSLTEAELLRLNALLALPEARARLAQEWVLSEQIAEAVRADQARRSAQQQAQAYETLELHQADDATAAPTARRKVIRLTEALAALAARARWRWTLPLAAGLAALIAVTMLWFAPDSVGQLEQVSGGVTIQRGHKRIAVSSSGFRLRSGDELALSATASATIAYDNDATRLRTQPGARLVLGQTDDNGKRVELLAGAVSASVAPQPKDQPMRLITPHAVATVLGTEFSFAVGVESSRLEVVEGSVRLARREDEKSIVVPAGFYAVAGARSELTPRSLLPAPWQSQDIGQTGRPGNALWDAKNNCRVAGGGAEHRRSPDGRMGWDPFHFVYQTLEGDGEIRARVLGFESKDKRTKAGVVIRESLKNFAPTAFLRVNAGRGLEFIKRKQRGETKTELVGEETFPYWVRLARRGDTITAYKSPDGVNWTETGSGTFEIGPVIYIGLGVTSADKSGPNTAVFDNISVVAARAAPAF